MKKIFALILSLVLVFSFTACGEKEEKVEGGANAVWNHVEYDSLEKVNEALGVELCAPGVMGVTDKSFMIIDDDIAEYQFSVNGIDCTFRACPSFDEDISGIYLGKGTAFQGRTPSDDIDYLFTDEYKLARWATIDGQYVFEMKDDGSKDEETFKGIAEELKELTKPGLNDAELMSYYESLAGDYYDSYSQRATAVLSATEEGLHFEVLWSSSASETTKWEFTARLGEDGLLSYNDEKKTNLVYGADGSEQADLVSENVSGYLFEEGGIITWIGANDESCRDCCFEKAE